ncbi:hypothetical protein B0T16DRAFT_387064 [Cercophora newfieldiana]|uniref:Uncharacterized protein n=1 Tax=Cercophora newfieldiana TaxID=92897 RepID=A0AA39YIK6_9PEZI|nr:hypothetical protein B0T16DRAFT_387064 [Cercophora newfieldiana]
MASATNLRKEAAVASVGDLIQHPSLPQILSFPKVFGTDLTSWPCAEFQRASQHSTMTLDKLRKPDGNRRGRVVKLRETRQKPSPGAVAAGSPNARVASLTVVPCGLTPELRTCMDFAGKRSRATVGPKKKGGQFAGVVKKQEPGDDLCAARYQLQTNPEWVLCSYCVVEERTRDGSTAGLSLLTRSGRRRLQLRDSKRRPGSSAAAAAGKGSNVKGDWRSNITHGRADPQRPGFTPPSGRGSAVGDRHRLATKSFSALVGPAADNGIVQTPHRALVGAVGTLVLCSTLNKRGAGPVTSSIRTARSVASHQILSRFRSLPEQPWLESCW